MNFVFWEFLVAILLGLVQALTEFLPISSTAHLGIFGRLLLQGRDFGLTASVAIQLGTTVALLIYFRQDLKVLWQHFTSFFKSQEARQNWWFDTLKWWQGDKSALVHFSDAAAKNVLLTQLVIATAPIVIFGLLFQNFIARSLRGNVSMAAFLLLGAVLLLLAEQLNERLIKLNQKSNQSQPAKPTALDVSKHQTIIIGLFQALAVFNGMSRSGSTIAGALMVGLNRPQAARYAFLLGIPALTLSGLKSLFDLILDRRYAFHWWPEASFWQSPDLLRAKVNLSFLAILLATLVAFGVGYLVLKWFLPYLAKYSTKYFAYYRIALALLLILANFVFGLLY